MKKRDVADETGLDEHVIAEYYYEQVKMFRIDTLLKLCKALGLKSINELIEIEYIPNEETTRKE